MLICGARSLLTDFIEARRFGSQRAGGYWVMVEAQAATAPSVFAPHRQRADWFVIPADWLAEVAGVPSVQIDRRHGPIVHRSHLPLLAQRFSEVARSLERSRLDRPSDREALDQATIPLGWKLRPYQHVGREFILSRRGALVADQMRLGKSPQAIASHDPASGPLVVVAPLATREVWLSWFRRRWPEVRPIVLSGRIVDRSAPRKLRKQRVDRGYTLVDGTCFDPNVVARAPIIFCNYDVLTSWKTLGGLDQSIGTLVLDEAHLLSNRKARRTQAAVFLSTAARRVVALTGTPLWNKPAGLYPILSCLCSGGFGKYYEFAVRYAAGRNGPHGFVADGSSHEEEFRLRMSEVMIRRTWQDVASDLPPIERTVETVAISENQAHAIELEAERVRNHAKRSTAIGALARFRRLLARLKVDGAIDAALRVLQSGERVVVWTWHRDVALKIEDTLAKQGFPGFVLTGKTNAETRDLILDRWRTCDAAPLVITMAVGQVGIDLSAARQAVFAELDFTPSVVAQAEMRVFAATRPTAVTYVIVDHEIDRKILDALQTKCETAFRLGVPAAETAIEVLTQAFAHKSSADEFQALADAVLRDHPEIDEDDDYHGALWNHDWETE